MGHHKSIDTCNIGAMNLSMLITIIICHTHHKMSDHYVVGVVLRFSIWALHQSKQEIYYKNIMS